MKNVDLDFFKKEEKKNNLLEKDKTVINNSDETFDILTLDDPETQQKLKRYDLDIDSVKEFRSKIKKVSKKEANILGAKLCDLLNKKYVDFIGLSKLILDGANVNYCIEYNGFFPLLMCFDKLNNSSFFKFAIELIKAGANINLRNDIMVIRNPHFRNSIRIVFDEINSPLSNENAIKLFDLLLLLRVKITRDDYTYFKNFETSPLNIKKPIYYELINKILKIYPYLASDNFINLQDTFNNYNDRKTKDFNNIYKLLTEETQESLIESATKKLEEIKQDNIFESIDKQKKKVLK